MVPGRSFLLLLVRLEVQEAAGTTQWLGSVGVPKVVELLNFR